MEIPVLSVSLKELCPNSFYLHKNSSNWVLSLYNLSLWLFGDTFQKYLFANRSCCPSSPERIPPWPLHNFCLSAQKIIRRKIKVYAVQRNYGFGWLVFFAGQDKNILLRPFVDVVFVPIRIFPQCVTPLFSFGLPRIILASLSSERSGNSICALFLSRLGSQSVLKNRVLSSLKIDNRAFISLSAEKLMDSVGRVEQRGYRFVLVARAYYV